MASLNTIISWFESRKKPTAPQFAESWRSFWHKDEPISIDNIEGLSQLLQNVSTVDQVNTAIAIAQEALAAASKNYPSGKANITPEGYRFDYDPAYPEGSDHKLYPYCSNAEGTVGFVIIDRSNTGFTVVPVDNAEFVYFTLPI